MLWITKFWNNYGLEFLVIITIVFFLFLWLIKTRHQKGRGKMSLYKDLYIPSKQFLKNPKKAFSNLYNDYGQDELGFELTQPEKNDSKGEVECRRVVQDIFKRPFSKTRPDFLRNVNGQNLELDMYNDELKIAVEYNGRQHYEFVPYFHRTKESFNNQKQRDFIKRLLCEKQGIFLIEVPYTVKIDDIKYFIMDKLDKFKLK